MASIGYPNPVPVGEVVLRLGQAAKAGYHEFWPDELSLTDPGVFVHTQLLGPKQITDRYLLALAAKKGGRLVIFDRALRPTAVVGASGRHLVQL